jgi:hypothetical protein
MNPDEMRSATGCAEAQIYFYDFLAGEASKSVPPDQALHINQCPSCQARLRELELLLKDPARRFRPGTRERNAAIVRLLKSHFAYLDRLVDCSNVKLFLPSMADPVLEISTLTPIAVHIDQCPECSADLHAIRQLRLTQGQLSRLTGFLANAESVTDTDAPRQSDARQGQPQPLQSGREESSCTGMSSQDVFDCVLPHSSAGTIGTAHDPAGKSQPCQCPECLGRIQLMRQTLTWIAQRPSSGVLTCLRLRNQEDNAPQTEGGTLYADWPVDVQVLKQMPVSSRQSSERPLPYQLPRQRAAAAIRRLPRWAAAAAALLVVGYAMFVGTPSVQAVTLRQLYEALQRASNVCIASILPDAAEPRQKEWISRSLNLIVFEDRDAHALWDMSSQTIRIRSLKNEDVEIGQMSDEVFARGHKQMIHAPGLVPFDEIADLPEGTTWEMVGDASVAALVPGTQAYDLVWNSPIPMIPPAPQTERWRFFIDPQTHLPARVEIYSQGSTELQPRLYKTYVVSYPTDQEIQTLAKTLFSDFRTNAAVHQP